MSIEIRQGSDFVAKNKYIYDKTPDEHMVAIYVRDTNVGQVSSHGKAVSKKNINDKFKSVNHAAFIIPRPLHVPPEDRVQVATLSPSSPVTYFPALTKLHDMNLRINVTGASGSGKSFFVGQMIALLQKREKRHVFVISQVEEDNALDVHDPIRINMDDDEFMELSAKSFADSLVIFDDVDGHHDKKIRDFATRLRDALLKTGRHGNTDIISVSHEIRDRQASRTLLLESTHFVFYPQANMRSMLKYFEDYHRYKTDELRTLRKRYSDYNQGRWVIFHKNVPQYFLTERDLRLEESDY